ncbi:MAG: hypothetical protein ACRCXK_13360 [Wohlfahrtiimonas sp.]
MNNCDTSSFQNLTTIDFLTILIDMAFIIGIYALIGIVFLYILKFLYSKLELLFSKRIRQRYIISKARKNYTRKQFIEDCNNHQIDLFVAKVFWNFCEIEPVKGKYLYKPQLNDELELFFQCSLGSAIQRTIHISGYKGEIDIAKIANIKDVLLLLSKE